MSIISRSKYSELVDAPKLQALMESFSQVIGIANAVIDVDGIVIAQAGWQDACTGFHRVNAETCRRCIESDTSLAESMTRGLPFAVYRCPNGLVDSAAPIIVDDQHVASVFTGQFLTAPPDPEFFRKQARQFGFDEVGYLEAIAEVPVLTEERVESVTRLYAQLAGMLADNGLDRLREIKTSEKLVNLNKALEEKVAARTQALARANDDLLGREALLRQILDTSSVAIFLLDREGRITQANQRMAEMFGSSLDALEGKEYIALVHPGERERGRQKMLELLASAIPSVDLDRLYWRADRTEFWGRLTCKRFYDASGEERGLIGVIADITKRKQAEDRLRELNVTLERRVAARTDELLVANRNLEEEIGVRKIAESSALDFATRLQAMTRRHAGAQESERRRLARELHDQVSSSLTAIGLSLGLIAKQLPQDAAAKVGERLSDTVALLKDTMLTAREISHDLHPAVLEYGGVIPALKDYGRKYFSHTGIAVEVVGKDREIRLPPEKEIALYRIAQEALTNCAKYAEARTVTMDLNGDAEHAIFVIADDGAGFDLVKLSDGKNTPGLGLLSMRERAEAIGGKLRLESSPGLGTRITVEI